MSDYQRSITFRAAYDCEHYDCVAAGTDRECTGPGNGRYHGRHGVDMTAVLQKDGRAVQFVLYTNWMRPLSRPGAIANHNIGGRGWCPNEPMPAELGYHSPVPMYDDQLAMSDECVYTDGVCYYDGSGLNADPVFDRLTMEGDEGMWAALEEYYEGVFQ